MDILYTYWYPTYVFKNYKQPQLLISEKQNEFTAECTQIFEFLKP